jgi:hypothetical protein
MRWLKSVAREILGLFVDDAGFAIAILIWLAFAVAVLPRLAPAARWPAPALFAGLALILIESTLRYSRKNRK